MSINSSSSKIVSEVSATLDVTSITQTSCIRLVMITCLLQVRFTIRRLADTLCLLTIVLVRPEGDCVVFILETDVCPSFSTLTSDLSLLMTAVTFTYSGSSCVWAANRLGLVATAELLKLSSYDVW